MPVTQTAPAPYTSPASVLDFIRRYRDRGLQSPFTRDVLVRAGVAETLVQRTLQSLVTLDLVDLNGMPTPTLDALRRAPQAEYPQRFGEFLRAAYAEVFSYVDPATNTFEEVRDAFRAYEPHGQQERMVALFMGLCAEAGITGESSRQRTPREPQRRERDQRVRAAATIVQRAARRHGPPSTPRTPTNGGGQQLPPALIGLLDSLPAVGAGWAQSRRDKFVETFGAVLDFCYPIREQESEPVEEETS